jgi:hypothetical protein
VTIRVTPATRDRLNRLSAKRGITTGELVDELASEAESRSLLDAMAAHYEELQADPDEAARHRDELRAWDGTAADGLQSPE